MFEESIWTSMNSWFTPTVLFVLLNLMIGTIAITTSLANSQKPRQNNDENHNNNQHQQHQIERSPSVLHRLKSINFYSYRSQEPTTNYFSKNIPESDHHEQQQQQSNSFFRSPSVLQRLKSIGRYSSPPEKPEPASTEGRSGEREGKSIEEIYSELKSGGGDDHVVRSQSGGGDPAKPRTKLAKKMKKSASAKSAFAHFRAAEAVDAAEAAEELEKRRPATVREGKASAPEKEDDEDDEEVDAKADDFINKFKQQLKLQRLDSIIRYKEMIRGGK